MSYVVILEAIFMFVALPVLCLTAIIVAAILRLGKNRKPEQAGETRLIQEMHRGLETLESRIESLETIILEHEREKGEAEG